MGGGWVVEVDIRKFFDTLDHSRLREILRQRIRDGTLLRLVGKWLNAGVHEAGAVSASEIGTPQGGVISPLLANIYLHEVLDTWFEREVRPRLLGRATLVRYADDLVIVLSGEQDARRVIEVLPKRFGKYGLTLHPEKNEAGAVRAPSALSKAERRRERRGIRDVRLARLHAPLGAVPQGILGDQAANGGRPIRSGAATRGGLVSA